MVLHLVRILQVWKKSSPAFMEMYPIGCLSLLSVYKNNKTWKITMSLIADSTAELAKVLLKGNVPDAMEMRRQLGAKSESAVGNITMLPVPIVS